MVIHVVLGFSAFGNFRTALKRAPHLDGEIICLKDDLSIGPIKNLNTAKARTNRTRWLKKIFVDSEYLSSEEKSKLMDDWKLIKSLKKSKDPIYIWKGQNAYEELGSIRLIYELKKINCPLYLIDYPKQKTNFKKEKFIATSMSKMPPIHIPKLIKYKQKLTIKKINEIVSIWKNITKYSKYLRIRTGKYTYSSKPLNFFDQQIIRTPKKSLLNTVYTFRSKSDTNPNPDYLSWRIRISKRGPPTLKKYGPLNQNKLRI